MRLLLRIFGQPVVSERREVLLRRVLGVSALALVLATWPLWTAARPFPQVPLFGIVLGLPDWCDACGRAGMMAGLVLALVARGGRWATAGLLLFAGTTTGVVVLDQLRLQPWAYQFMLMAVVLALAERNAAFALLRLLIVSFYLHSALTKFDYSFLHTQGQQFLGALAGSSIDNLSDEARVAAAAIFPAGELLVAALLCFGRTRGWGVAAAIVLHGLLLVILGPWGLDHKPAVLLWNVFFIVQAVLIFGRPGPKSAIAPHDRAPPDAQAPWAVQGLIYAAVLLPFLSSTCWYDMWPSWGLYASSSQRVVLFVHRNELDAMPDDLRAYVEEPADTAEPWLRVRLDRWCLAAVAAPLYPQNRYQLGVAEAVIAGYVPSHRARVIRFDLADRWTGQRRHDILSGLAQLAAVGDEYILNARPRRSSTPVARPLGARGGVE